MCWHMVLEAQLPMCSVICCINVTVYYIVIVVSRAVFLGGAHPSPGLTTANCPCIVSSPKSYTCGGWADNGVYPFCPDHWLTGSHQFIALVMPCKHHPLMSFSLPAGIVYWGITLGGRHERFGDWMRTSVSGHSFEKCSCQCTKRYYP